MSGALASKGSTRGLASWSCSDVRSLMTAESLLTGEVLIWLIAISAIVVSQEKQRIESAGLVLGYALNLWLMHWPGAAVYALPWYSRSGSATRRVWLPSEHLRDSRLHGWECPLRTDHHKTSTVWNRGEACAAAP